LPFFWAKKTVNREKLFLGAFCKGKLIFLKSSQKDGHFDTHIDLFQEKNVLTLCSGFRKFWAPRM
jgi:hypothetical protein